MRTKRQGVAMRVECYTELPWRLLEPFLHSCANRLEVPKSQEETGWLLRSPYFCTVVLMRVPQDTDPETRMWIQVVHLGGGPKKRGDGLGK